MVTIVDKILEQNGKIERDISRIGTFDNGEIGVYININSVYFINSTSVLIIANKGVAFCL